MGASCRKLCSSGTVQAAGSVLDRVISQASNEDNTVLYKLADYKKGGALLETYARGGMTAAEKLMREELSGYMYAAGQGRVINRAEYLRWKFRDQKQVVLPIEASLSPHDPLAKWEDHPACWQMSYRGALGESLLHVLIICDTKVHTRLARTLVKCFPKLSMDVVEGEEYLGASSLHLAIAYSNNELVQDLVEAGADVGQRAIGSFFLPRDQQCNPPARQTNYEGLAYLGEYPLAWAACCANESVYNLLLDSGADPDVQDSFGNMILHMVVVCDKLDMFGYALRHPKLPASNGRVNHAGHTPLTLACHLGRDSVFREMLELSAREFWRYSNITCSGYPLNALDTLLPDGRTNWNSALFIILNGTKQEHLNMLDGGIIQRLLEEKWKTFARTKFLKRLLILMLHLLLLSLSVYLRHSSLEADASPDWGLKVEDVRSGVRLACELGTIASTLCYIILQQGDELKNQGLVAYIKQLVHEPAKFIFLASNILLLMCIPARLSQQTSVEEAILIFVLPGSWFLLMFFAGAVKLTGPFVTMIYSMITGDMFTFGIIYCIVLFGFSQSFYFLYRGFPNVQSTLYSSYPTTWMALFQITLGDYSYTDLAQTTYPNLSKTVFALFMVFVPILLLNMLIAMMGNTYAHVIEQSEKEWVKQWAKIVVSLERSVAQEDAHRYLQEYSIGLGPSDDPRYEQRAVMVIKSKDKTRAKQRKGALTNWKRVGKVTIAELRRRGVSGEQLRALMWGRASISSPTRHPRPRAGPVEVPGAVGEMVSSALDVMSFTHDIHVDICSKPTPDLLMNGRSPLTAIPPVTSSLPLPPTQALPPGIVTSNTSVTKQTLNLPPSLQNQSITAQNMPQNIPTYGLQNQQFLGQIPPNQITLGQPSPMPTVPVGQVSMMGGPGQMAVPAQSSQVLGQVSLGPGQMLGLPPGQCVIPPGPQALTMQSQFIAGTATPSQGVGMNVLQIPGSLLRAPVPTEQVYRDYFREYMSQCERAAPGERSLLDLLERATDIQGVPEVDPALLNVGGSNGLSLVCDAMSGLFGSSASPALPAPAATRAWRSGAREHSDSDTCVESLLGRSARARRARSAAQRAPALPHLYVPARSMYLAASESSALESDAPTDDQHEHNTENIVRAVRPLCIAAATGAAPQHHSVFVVGSGSGAETESAPPPTGRSNQYEKKRERPKTAKFRQNRVSPGTREHRGSPLEPWATAPLAAISRRLRRSLHDTHHDDASTRSDTDTY